MKYFTTLLVLLLGLSTAWSQTTNPLLGQWKTIDDETGRIKSVVEITERDGRFYGQIIELFRLPEEDQNPLCTGCEDDRKDQPSLGMEIVRDMEASGKDKEWEEGTICDPKTGKIYDCEMWLDSDNMDELKVRGYIYFLFRTQSWMRVASE
tara:strand:- start:287 stop:739 length:453 start_codon:yes stop_codon:yes gene_type:complete